MNIEEQLHLEHSVKNTEIITAFIENNPQQLKELLRIILLGEDLLSQRGAWCLSKFSNKFYLEFIPYLAFIFSEIDSAKHNAVSRNFSKVFFKLTEGKNLEKLTDNNIDEIIDISFGWVIDDRSKPAVVAFGMYTLMNLLEKRTWIAHDLKLHIEKNMAGSLPSFRAAGKKVLKAINKTK
jgi:hypothetical protein